MLGFINLLKFLITTIAAAVVYWCYLNYSFNNNKSSNNGHGPYLDQELVLPTTFAIEVVDWKNTKMDKLGASHIIDYFLWTNQSSCQAVQYFGGKMYERGISVVYDGQKAICLDSKIAPSPDKCIVYSFGINHEWSFDEAMELYGCEIFAFDPSMNVSSYNRTEYIHFHQMALDSYDKKGWGKYEDVLTRTLSSIYEILKPYHGDEAIIDYLKLENSVSTFRQLAKILQSIEDYGMIRFDSRRNVLNSVVEFTKVENFSAVENYEIAW